jgi:hypothetical protein
MRVGLLLMIVMIALGCGRSESSPRGSSGVSSTASKMPATRRTEKQIASDCERELIKQGFSVVNMTVKLDGEEIDLMIFNVKKSGLSYVYCRSREIIVDDSAKPEIRRPAEEIIVERTRFIKTKGVPVFHRGTFGRPSSDRAELLQAEIETIFEALTAAGVQRY